MTHKHTKDSKGFTIVELMISTAVFSLILVVILGAVTQIGRMYYKGITTAQTQNATRLILNDISQRIQFSPDVPSISGGGAFVFSDSSSRGLCIGQNRYLVQLNKQVSSSNNAALNQQRHALWFDDRGTALCDITTAPDYSANLQNDPPISPIAGATYGKEMLEKGMRIVKLVITNEGGPNPRLWTVTVRVVFGEDDLLDATGGIDNTVCSGSQIGTQFCAVSELSTTVLRRVQ